MLLKIDRSGALVVDNAPQRLLVSDEDFLLLSSNKEAQRALLEDLGWEVVYIERLGNEVVPGTEFVREDVKITLPDLPVKKEMGYHSRL